MILPALNVARCSEIRVAAAMRLELPAEIGAGRPGRPSAIRNRPWSIFRGLLLRCSLCLLAATACEDVGDTANRFALATSCFVPVGLVWRHPLPLPCGYAVCKF